MTAVRDVVNQHLPAQGPKLSPAIEQATGHLEGLLKRREDRSALWLDHAKVWKELLRQSKSRPHGEVAPSILKGDLASPLAIDLTGRYWASFQKWFMREIASDLQQISNASGIPALFPARIANNGGHPAFSESVYYLSYPMPATEPRLTDNTRLSAEGQVENRPQGQYKKSNEVSSAETTPVLARHTTGVSVAHCREMKPTAGAQRLAYTFFCLGIFLLQLSLFLAPGLERSVNILLATVILLAGVHYLKILPFAFAAEQTNRGQQKSSQLIESDEKIASQ